MSLIPLLGALAVVASVPLAWWALSSAATVDPVTRNLRGRNGSFTDYRDAVLARSARDRAVAPVVEGLARRARALTPTGALDNIERRLLRAGASDRWPLERVLAAKVVSGLVAAVLSALWFAGSPSLLRLVLGLAAIVAGYLLPDLLLHNAAQKRQLAIQRALPDLLDQMTIGVEAGLAFEAAVQRAGRSGTTPLHRELVRTMQDVQAGMARSEAFKGLVARTEVEDLRHFVLAMVQAEAYGVPVSRVLRVQAGEMRVKRRQRAEEAAMKLPVKILFPIMLFILPAVFVVLLGPAVLRMGDAFG